MLRIQPPQQRQHHPDTEAMGPEVPGRPRIGVPISTDPAPHEELLAEPDQVWRPTSPRPPGVPLVDRLPATELVVLVVAGIESCRRSRFLFGTHDLEAVVFRGMMRPPANARMRQVGPDWCREAQALVTTTAGGSLPATSPATQRSVTPVHDRIGVNKGLKRHNGVADPGSAAPLCGSSDEFGYCLL